MTRRILVVVNPHREDAAHAAALVTRELEAEGIEVRTDFDKASDGSVEAAVVLGGDGTILRALRRYTGTTVPVFGINYGTVGFLAAAEPDDLEAGLARAMAGHFETVSLPGLEVTIGGETQIAVNDVSFTRRPHHRVADLSYSVGGSEVGRVRCDGLVIAGFGLNIHF